MTQAQWHWAADRLIARAYAVDEWLASRIFHKADDDGLGQRVAEERIQDLRNAFARSGREFPDVPAPDMEETAENFNDYYRDRLDALAANFDEPESADAQARLGRAGAGLRTAFGQHVDGIIQPHYGVEYFIWRGNGACQKCAPYIGTIGRWGASEAPPLHPNCRCTA
jgi:hypothetical protein